MVKTSNVKHECYFKSFRRNFKHPHLRYILITPKKVILKSRLKLTENILNISMVTSSILWTTRLRWFMDRALRPGISDLYKFKTGSNWRAAGAAL